MTIMAKDRNWCTKAQNNQKCEQNNPAHDDFHAKTLTLSSTYNVSQVNVVKTTIVWRLHFIPQKAEWLNSGN